MTQQEKDEAAAADKYSSRFQPENGWGRETARDGFLAGAAYARKDEQERAKALVEALDELLKLAVYCGISEETKRMQMARAALAKYREGREGA